MTPNEVIAGAIYASQEWPADDITKLLCKLDTEEIRINHPDPDEVSVWWMPDLTGPGSTLTIKNASHIDVPVDVGVRQLLNAAPRMRLLLSMTPPLNNHLLVQLARALSDYAPVVLDDMRNPVRPFPETGTDDQPNLTGPPMDLDTALDSMFEHQTGISSRLERWPPALEPTEPPTPAARSDSVPGSDDSADDSRRAPMDIETGWFFRILSSAPWSRQHLDAFFRDEIKDWEHSPDGSGWMIDLPDGQYLMASEATTQLNKVPRPLLERAEQLLDAPVVRQITVAVTDGSENSVGTAAARVLAEMLGQRAAVVFDDQRSEPYHVVHESRKSEPAVDLTQRWIALYCSAAWTPDQVEHTLRNNLGTLIPTAVTRHANSNNSICWFIGFPDGTMTIHEATHTLHVLQGERYNKVRQLLDGWPPVRQLLIPFKAPNDPAGVLKARGHRYSLLVAVTLAEEAPIVFDNFMNTPQRIGNSDAS